MNKSATLEMHQVCKRYRQGSNELTILEDASLTVRKGEMVALVGESGSGKSTLLHLAGLLDTPDSGSIAIGGTPVERLSDGKKTALRRNHIGFIYQFHHLLPDFTTLENVVLPQLLTRTSTREAKAYATELLERLGLAERLRHRPGQLSGGEQQRVAIARALANRPALLLADEPTGNLDPDTSHQVFTMLVELAVDSGLSMLVVTHNMELAQNTDRMLRLEHGKIVPKGN